MLLTPRYKKLDQRGDTVVEVLVVIAILSLILSGAFILTNRSLQSARSAQERLSAIKLVESQLEQIKNVAGTINSPTIFGAAVPNPFCINTSGAVVAATDAACTMGTEGNPTTGQPAYKISVTRSGNDFTVNNRWASVTGRGEETIIIKYRAYE
jgi:prepilin-type N-terminal cleavage/methylation domain-containing protein